MAKLFVGVTDKDWYEFLSKRPDLTEANFWQPGGVGQFRALGQGELFLFKLHSPDNYVVGGGFFAASSLLPVSIAWETFGPMNGVASLPEMRRRIERLRREKSVPNEDYTIGNIVLEQAFFFRRDAWIPIPSSFALNIVRGRTYDTSEGDGLALASAVAARLQAGADISFQRSVAEGVAGRMFSDPVLARRRLGQGAFRLLVTDNYGRRCAVTGEHTLIVLQAAHIRPVTEGGEHRVSNGLLLRSDVHTLFDKGYVTVTPEYRFRVSGRLDSEWKNGRVYYQLSRREIHLPKDKGCRPDRDLLAWHEAERFIA